MTRFTDIQLTGNGFTGQDGDMSFSAEFSRFLIHEAWGQGCDFEELADGFGVGNGTHGDWSAIRDSSEAAITTMFERALNHLFGAKCDCGLAYLVDPNGIVVGPHNAECATRQGVPA